MIEKFEIIYNHKKYTETHFFEFISANYKPCSKLLLLMRRSPDLLFAICMCLEKGITYIPIDPTYPKERIQYIIGDSNADDMITDVDSSVNFQLSQQPTMSRENAAYILYTSGSTGNPKGVEVTYEGLMNFIEGISEAIDFSPGKRIACLTTVSFDIFFLESIMALYKGLTVVLANEDEQYNPKLMAKLIQDTAVDMIQMTPSRMQLLLNYDKELSCLKNVKDIMIGGEPFPLCLLRTLQEKTTAKIYNMYGPTETTIWSTISDLTHKDHVNIGRPIKATEVYIMDETFNILPKGQAGEICIAGKGLAKGYWGRDDLTAEKFIYLSHKPNIKVYRTGDIGRYLPDGDLEYLGRADNQVKIRGHRIELEEIEIYLNQFEYIRQSVVIVLGTSETEKILKAFYTSDSNIDPRDITDFLSEKLPSYMIPAIFKRVKEFALTANGKIDRRRVLEYTEYTEADTAMPQESVPNRLTDIQKTALDVVLSNLDSTISENVSVDTDISSVGFDSITFIKVVIALETEFDFEFDVDKLLVTAFMTIRSMLEYVELKTAAEPAIVT